MFYSLAVLHPRARAFFATQSQFEAFITFIAAGARWKVLLGCAVIAVTGLILTWLHGSTSFAWQACIGAKALLFTIAVSIFAYASWFAWPARILAAPDEIPAFQRRFRFIAVALIALVVLCFLLSVLAHHEHDFYFQPGSKLDRLSDHEQASAHLNLSGTNREPGEAEVEAKFVSIGSGTEELSFDWLKEPLQKNSEEGAPGHSQPTAPSK